MRDHVDSALAAGALGAFVVTKVADGTLELWAFGDFTIGDQAVVASRLLYETAQTEP